jgi:putative ABC transport system ATP-binding protein
MQILKTDSLEKTYEDNNIPVHALKGINITINKNDFLVIAGPSGSGKTTLLNLLGALDTPTKGKVFFENEGISTKTRNQLAGLRLKKNRFHFSGI